MEAVVVQHVPFEGPGWIENWLQVQGARVFRVSLWEPDARLPEPTYGDIAVVMGGPMSVNDEDAYPWLAVEKEYLRARIREGRPTLGICLGAQAIASAVGAPVYRAREREIGWFPIYGAEVPQGVFRFPPELTVLHWHGETFDLPPGAVRLATSPACTNQAFQIGRRVLGLQFHLEATRGSLQQLVEACRGDLEGPGAYVASEREIVAVPDQVLATANLWMERVLEYLCC